MGKKSILITLTLFAVIGGSTVTFALFDNQNERRTPVEFYSGHSHDANGTAIDAPQHSGGLDRKGCHNKSVPYHCH